MCLWCCRVGHFIIIIYIKDWRKYIKSNKLDLWKRVKHFGVETTKKTLFNDIRFCNVFQIFSDPGRLAYELNIHSYGAEVKVFSKTEMSSGFLTSSFLSCPSTHMAMASSSSLVKSGIFLWLNWFRSFGSQLSFNLDRFWVSIPGKYYLRSILMIFRRDIFLPFSCPWIDFELTQILLTTFFREVEGFSGKCYARVCVH